MTIEELNKLPDSELNRLVAERVMGYLFDGGSYLMPIAKRTSDNYKPEICWNPSTDHNDAALVRAEIERRGLQVFFVKNLMDIVLPCLGTESYEFGNLFKLTNATPRQTSIAAILAVEGVK